MGTSLFELVGQNPFYVLGVAPDCSRIEVERAGQKWLSMLALQLKEARSYETPVGLRERTETLVREAVADLRDPRRRLFAELVAQLPPNTRVLTPREVSGTRQRVRWRDAFDVFGYGPEPEDGTR